MFKYLFLFMELLLPLLSIIVMLLLYCIIVLYLTSNNLVLKDNFLYKISIMASSAANNSSYRMLILFNFSLLDIDTTAPCTIVIFITVRILIYGCTENYESTYHLMVFVLSADKVKTISFVLFNYFISLVNYFASTSFGLFTLMDNI